jgi:hypothetical protein
MRRFAFAALLGAAAAPAWAQQVIDPAVAVPQVLGVPSNFAGNPGWFPARPDFREIPLREDVLLRMQSGGTVTSPLELPLQGTGLVGIESPVTTNTLPKSPSVMTWTPGFAAPEGSSRDGQVGGTTNLLTAPASGGRPPNNP